MKKEGEAVLECDLQHWSDFLRPDCQGPASYMPV
jgi:hypothetical protein